MRQGTFREQRACSKFEIAVKDNLVEHSCMNFLESQDSSTMNFYQLGLTFWISNFSNVQIYRMWDSLALTQCYVIFSRHCLVFAHIKHNMESNFGTVLAQRAQCRFNTSTVRPTRSKYIHATILERSDTFAMPQEFSV